MFTILLILFVIDTILLIPVILMQSGSGAQSGIFGGDITMGAFGAKTSEVLVNFTKWLVGAFFVLAFLMTYIKVMETKALQRAEQSSELSGAEGDTGSAPTSENQGASSLGGDGATPIENSAVPVIPNAILPTNN